MKPRETIIRSSTTLDKEFYNIPLFGEVKIDDKNNPRSHYDIGEIITNSRNSTSQSFTVRAADDALSRAGQVLSLADNAGETVFDRLLIETLHAPVLYAVKRGPILNDATREDALAAGVHRVADIVTTGSDAPGTILDRCSEEFRRFYDTAELVIAKGQANYETLSDQGPKVFFLLQAKCPVIARDAGVPVGSIILRQGRAYAEHRGGQPHSAMTAARSDRAWN